MVKSSNYVNILFEINATISEKQIKLSTLHQGLLELIVVLGYIHSATIIQGRQLFKGGNYSRKYGIC